MYRKLNFFVISYGIKYVNYILLDYYELRHIEIYFDKHFYEENYLIIVINPL